MMPSAGDIRTKAVELVDAVYGSTYNEGDAWTSHLPYEYDRAEDMLTEWFAQISAFAGWHVQPPTEPGMYLFTSARMQRPGVVHATKAFDPDDYPTDQLWLGPLPAIPTEPTP